MNTEDRDKLLAQLIDYLEGALDSEQARRVEGELVSSETLRRERAWLEQAYADLDAMGQGFAGRAPQVDVVRTVAETLKQRPSQHESNATRKRVAARREWLRWGLGLAMAAALIIALGLAWYQTTSVEPGRRIAPDIAPGLKFPEVPVPVPETVPLEPVTPFDKLKGQLREQSEKLRPSKLPRSVLAQEPVVETPSLNDVLAARRDPGSGMARLIQWAQLNKDKARQWAADPETPPAILVAAAAVLSPNESERALLTAVGHLPEDPHARLELARALSEQGTTEKQAEAAAQAPAIRNLDPDNALPYYLEAKVAFDRGDMAAGLQALEAAAQLGTASAYAMESALGHAQALVDSGMQPEVARLLSALTAGADQYEFLYNLASDLLQYGQGFMAEQDYATAEQIIEAVQQFGRQVEEGAQFSQEAIAGLDIQTAAIDVLSSLYTTVESDQGIEDLTAQTQELVGRIYELNSFFDRLNELLFRDGTAEFWNLVTGIILQSGDLLLFDYLDPSALTGLTGGAP